MIVVLEKAKANNVMLFANSPGIDKDFSNQFIANLQCHRMHMEH